MSLGYEAGIASRLGSDDSSNLKKKADASCVWFEFQLSERDKVGKAWARSLMSIGGRVCSVRGQSSKIWPMDEAIELCPIDFG